MSKKELTSSKITIHYPFGYLLGGLSMTWTYVIHLLICWKTCSCRSTSLHSPNLLSILHTCRLLKYQCITCLEEHTRIIFLVHGPGNIESCRSSTKNNRNAQLPGKILEIQQGINKKNILIWMLLELKNLDHFSLNHGSLRIPLDVNFQGKP